MAAKVPVRPVLTKHLKRPAPKKTSITATPKSLMDDLCNQGPVDTPAEIQYRYYNNGPVDTPGEQQVRYHNPGPKDTPGELKTHERPGKEPENKKEDEDDPAPPTSKKI